MALAPERTTTLYKSVIVFGKASIVSSDDEKKAIMAKFVMRYIPNQYDDKMANMDWAIPVVNVIRSISPECPESPGNDLLTIFSLTVSIVQKMVYWPMIATHSFSRYLSLRA